MLNTRPNKFRTSFTTQEGFEAALIVQCRIVDVNLTNWTVDCLSQFDRKRYFSVQLGSPYLHYSSGEGMSVTPEVGAVCMVCIPSDSSPPFVLSFLMPHSLVDSGTETSAERSGATRYATDATFAGNRAQSKPGDITFHTRDGNFLKLHRGGVVQIGATELSQRIFIPMGNLMMDLSGNYAHHNTGGSVLWGIQEGLAENNLPCLFTQNFKVKANDVGADVRVRVGEVRVPLGEPSGEDSDFADLGALGIGTDLKKSPIICEISVSKNGFVPGTGDNVSAQDTVKNAVFRFFFDRKGGTLLRCNGSLLISTKKKMKIKVKEEMEIEAKSLSMSFSDGAVIGGGTSTHIQGDLVRMGAGAAPVARQGDIVTVVVPPSIIPILGIVGGPPGPASAGAPVTGFVLGGQMVGTITSGNPTVLA